MSRIVPGRKYTHEEVKALANDPDVAERALTGYVLRQNLDGTVEWVHWTKATNNQRNPRGGTANFEPLPILRKRTPQERVDSMMARLIEDCRRTGTIPGVTDARLSAILGYTKDTTRQGVTAEDLRRIVQHFLTDAEDKHKDSLRKKVADYRPS